MSVSEFQAKIFIRLLGRIAVPESKVRSLVVGTGKDSKKKKFLHAFNLADGSLTSGEIAKKSGIDAGNFSRLLAKWEKSGIIFIEQTGKIIKPHHIYPIDGITADPRNDE